MLVLFRGQDAKRPVDDAYDVACIAVPMGSVVDMIEKRGRGVDREVIFMRRELFRSLFFLKGEALFLHPAGQRSFLRTYGK